MVSPTLLVAVAIVAILLSSVQGFITSGKRIRATNGPSKGLSAVILCAKRRTRISKKAGGAAPAPASSEMESSDDTSPDEVQGTSIPDAASAANPNFVKTAPIVIKKSEESQEAVGNNAVEDEWGVVPSEASSGSSLFENVQSKFLGDQQDRQARQARKRKIDLGGSFQSDLDDFNSRLLEGSENRKKSLREEKQESGPVKTVKDVFSFILVADFFVVIFFLVWFLAAAATQKANPFLLERFQDIFQPVVVPALTVLMTGSIASGVIGDRKEE